MISGINHIGISTANLDRSLSFYRDLIGMDLIITNNQFGSTKIDTITDLKNANGRVALLRIGETQLEIFEFSTPQGKYSDPNLLVCDHGINHICFEVTEIQIEYQRLKAAGVKFHCEPLDFPTAKATYGRDPDGNAFELRESK